MHPMPTGPSEPTEQPAVIPADASPEKRLFVELLTRDITLIAALLDLIDNSINSAVEPLADRLDSARGYVALASDQGTSPTVQIDLTLSSQRLLSATTLPASARPPQESMYSSSVEAVSLIRQTDYRYTA